MEDFSEIQRSIGRLEGKMDALIHEVRVSNVRHTSVGAALSKRITKVERKQTWLAGAAAAGLAILGFIFHR